MFFNYPGIKLESRRPQNCKTGHFNENVFKMSKGENCTCKACKNTVFHCQICKFVGFLLPSSSWLLKLLIMTPWIFAIFDTFKPFPFIVFGRKFKKKKKDTERLTCVIIKYFLRTLLFFPLRKSPFSPDLHDEFEIITVDFLKKVTRSCFCFVLFFFFGCCCGFFFLPSGRFKGLHSVSLSCKWMFSHFVLF